ncbi:Methyltransferase domain protein [Pseudoalteromonas sp. THAF3]|uniref:class I SAM-dependent methyltransferase n=1 Tax=Pseudoalteromonas sp. THAF3 TaxID=2587843 RepID=UPI001268E69D|nr:class I SAM-dependent methyltransferase [Pseudoalteromonas sp. THAF3]QFU03668.1 Methyltransferase domain protein [Pseudoalteromonas sp. THAF3]|tara:strand:+ start:6601 stop:7254 length:654 start_codon:yes stop_codon:yes gene_type:complete
MKANTCPLCQSSNPNHYYRDKVRDYWQCQRCALVFVAACQYVTAAQEKAIYDHHENDLDDPGYRRFLSRVFNPLQQRLVARSKGLDFGCGPAPLLAAMLQEQEHTVALYDLYYYPDQCVLNDRYDFICSTEVIEHLAEPNIVLGQWYELLRPGGTLALMTKLVINAERFATWHYKNDPTHIAFYSKDTFAYIAEQFGFNVEFIAADVIFLTRPRDRD